MRIVIDLQGAQSTGSRNRGIGRYSLALVKAIVTQGRDHEVFLVLSNRFTQAVDEIYATFSGVLHKDNIRIWKAPCNTARNDASNNWRREAAEQLREAFIGQLQPDVVLITSLFEGLGDDALATVKKYRNDIATAVVLYDLIPLINQDLYLSNADVRKWYEEKISYLRRADLLLAISESSRQEGIKYLKLLPNAVVNISTAADDQFCKQIISQSLLDDIKKTYGLNRPFLMYTGGIDQRKNIERLIRAYATLPEPLRKSHQLAIVCSVQPENRKTLERLASQCGLSDGDLVLTGFVPEADLISLYNLCKAFIFPSWHEGFGLPALEAMHCGAPVIASNTSSLPEVVGNDESLFDPFNEQGIARKIEQVLSHEPFRQRLINHGLEQAKKFSWDVTAERALDALEEMYARRLKNAGVPKTVVPRPRLAYISPLPPERSGIADYSAELLPALAKHYEIEVIVIQEAISTEWINENCKVRTVEWLKNNIAVYDRLLYHFGNSTFHEHMFELLRTYPGVVILHDFFLSGIQAHREIQCSIKNAFTKSLYESHGYHAVRDRFHEQELADVVSKYPANFNVLQMARGIIVHSNHSKQLAIDWYGEQIAASISTVPLLRTPAKKLSRSEGRQMLLIPDDAFVIASFGIINPTKLNEQLLQAWLGSMLSGRSNCFLIFVGQNDGGPYGKKLLELISNSGKTDRVKITGWTDSGTFKDYLSICDVAVQLRSMSRGETSAAVLDCMNYGIPTIVNAHGSMADLDKAAVHILPDHFTEEELRKAIELLYRDESLRSTYAAYAQRSIAEQHSPLSCASQYADIVESVYENSLVNVNGLITSIARNSNGTPNHHELFEVAQAISQNLPFKRPSRQLLIDISDLVQGNFDREFSSLLNGLCRQLIEKEIAGYRIEPIYSAQNGNYKYARQFTLQLLNCPSGVLVDKPIDTADGDILLLLAVSPNNAVMQQHIYKEMRRQGVKVMFVVYDSLLHGIDADLLGKWLQAVSDATNAICASESLAKKLSTLLSEQSTAAIEKVRVSSFDLKSVVQNTQQLLDIVLEPRSLPLKSLTF